MTAPSIAMRPKLEEHLRSRDVTSTLAVWVGLFGGIIVLAYGYSYASRHPDSDQTHFHLFWIGELLFFVPALVQLLDKATSRGARLAIIVATAGFDYVPKYLRDPHFPLFHDELLHSREVAQVVATGHPFQPSPLLSIIQFFPGLHTTAASLEKLSGASPFLVASLLLLALHVSALVGVYVIAEALTSSARAGGLAAFVYSLNPSFLFFDSQFAYESLGIVLFVWTLAALVKAETSTAPRQRIGWVVLGVFSGCACVVTHHLSSYILAAMLLVACLISVRRAGSVGARWPWKNALADTVLAVTITGAAVAWLLFVASNAVGYIAPHVTSGVHEVLRLASHEQQSRTLFATSTTPSYERYAAFLSPVIALAGAVAAMRLMRNRWSSSPAMGGFFILAVLYFASLPFIYTTAGSEGARRSWGFTYLGVALVVAAAVDQLLDRPWRATKSTIILAGIIELTAIVYVGNVSASVNPFYRFPGPPSARSEVRTDTPELRAAAAWLARTQGPNTKIIADQLSGSPFAFFGQADPATPSAGFPTWQLYLSRKLPRMGLVSELRSSGYRYLVANGTIPLLASYYKTGATEQRPSSRNTTTAVISRFDQAPWMVKLYASEHVAIYRIDYVALREAESAAQRRRDLRRRR